MLTNISYSVIDAWGVRLHILARVAQVTMLISARQNL